MSARVPLFPSDDLRDMVRRRSISAYARMCVAEAIRSVADDIAGDVDALSATDRQWLRRAPAGPVNEATEEALRVLIHELASALVTAPARLRPAIAAAPPITRTDFE